jgi:hypothetical protein
MKGSRIIAGLLLIVVSCIGRPVLAGVYIKPGTTFYIQSVQVGLDGQAGYWDVPGYDPAYQSGQNLVVWDLSDRKGDRQFQLLYAGHENGHYWYYIAPVYTRGRGYVDVDHGRRVNGTNILIHAVNRSDAQKFRFMHLGEGRWKIYNKNGYAISLSGRSCANGSNIHLWEDHQGAWMEWRLRNVSTNTIYNPDVTPFGKVSDAVTGRPISTATVTVYNTNIPQWVPHAEQVKADGTFQFAAIEGIKHGYRVVISAPGYGSRWTTGHTTLEEEYLDIQLIPQDGYKAVAYEHFGQWLYEKAEDGYFYVDGQTESRDDYFFPVTSERIPGVVADLKREIGLDGKKAITDEEIYEQFKKVWEFWRTHTKSGMGRLNEPEIKPAYDFLFEQAGKWPSIQKYAESFQRFGFFLTMNCSATTIQFANLLTLTGISRDKLAIEVMHPINTASGEHWAVILKIKGHWFWIDPQCTSIPMPAYHWMKSIPAAKHYSYETPFKVYTFPGASNLRVPLCIMSE